MRQRSERGTRFDLANRKPGDVSPGARETCLPLWLRLVDHHQSRALRKVLGTGGVHPHVIVGITVQEEPVVGVLAIQPESHCLDEVPDTDGAAAARTMG